MGKLFCLIFLVLLFASASFPQKEFVSSNNPVYDFLERMNELRVILNYNSNEIPKTRKEIGEYLKKIDSLKTSLNKTDQGILSDLQVEFEFEIYHTLEKSVKIIDGYSYNLFSDKEKYLYFNNDYNGNALFINLIGEGESIFNKPASSSLGSSTLGIIGGEMRGTLLNKLGFFIKASNGYAGGDKNTAILRHELEYNFKFNEKTEERFFDNTEGYLTLDFDFFNFKLGRDRLRISNSNLSGFLDDNAPPFDYLGMNIKYSVFNFSWFHGKIQGYKSYMNDSITDGSSIVPEKYLGYHRFGFNLNNYFQFGIGEFIIYGERQLEFAYLNPFNFYKSAEHSGNDRDNSMLFFDLAAIPIEGFKLYSSLLIDDITFEKIGKGWYGNQTSLTTGASGSLFYYVFPIHFNAEYQRIEPYVFTHRLIRNNFTNSGYPLNSNALPNSEVFSLEFSHYFNKNILMSMDFQYIIHGANPIMNDGTVINVGGDINLGHRVHDSETIHLLDGHKEYLRKVGGFISYEPINNFVLLFRVNYVNNSLQQKVDRELQSYFSLWIKF